MTMAVRCCAVILATILLSTGAFRHKSRSALQGNQGEVNEDGRISNTLQAGVVESGVPGEGDMFGDFGNSASTQPILGGAAGKALSAALKVVGGSGSAELKNIMDSFEPKFMLVGGTSQAKDSLMMMMMGLPFAFQGKGIATRAPVLYRTVKSEDDMSVMLDQGAGPKSTKPESVVNIIEDHMHNVNGFAKEPIKVSISGDEVQTALYMNMMGRVNGISAETREDERIIDGIYDELAASGNVYLLAVEKTDVLPVNTMIGKWLQKVDPTGKRTIWVKTWADFGLATYDSDSGKTCGFVKEFYDGQDYDKSSQAVKNPTFWIATVEADSYLTDESMRFEERRQKLEEAIAKKEQRMSKFFGDWQGKGCNFDGSFSESHTKVTKLRQWLSDFHGKKVAEKLPEIADAIAGSRRTLEKDIAALEKKLLAVRATRSTSEEIGDMLSDYVSLWRALWRGRGDPQEAIKDGVTAYHIEEIRKKEWNLTAAEFFKAISKQFTEEGFHEVSGNPDDEVGYAEKFPEVGEILEKVGDPNAQPDFPMSFSGHFWSRLTSGFMLLLGTLKFDVRGSVEWGGKGPAGFNKCDAAVIQTQRRIQSFNGGIDFMLYAIKWVIKRHQKLTREVLWAMPKFATQKLDANLNRALDVVDQAYLTKWTTIFEEEFSKQRMFAPVNIHNPEIMKRFGVENASAVVEMGSLLQAEHDLAAECPSHVKAEWDRLGLEKNFGQSSSAEVYVNCALADRNTVYKVSCDSGECQGDEWCFVKNHCGGMFNRCKKLPVSPTCPKPEVTKPTPGSIHAARAEDPAEEETTLDDPELDGGKVDEMELKVLDDKIARNVYSLAKALRLPRGKDCDTLEEKLMSSAVDLMIMNVGALMNFMESGGEYPIDDTTPSFQKEIKRIIFSDLPEDFTEEDLKAEFPSMGEGRRLLTQVTAKKKDYDDLKNAESLFRRANSNDVNLNLD